MCLGGHANGRLLCQMGDMNNLYHSFLSEALCLSGQHREVVVSCMPGCLVTISNTKDLSSQNNTQCREIKIVQSKSHLSFKTLNPFSLVLIFRLSLLFSFVFLYQKLVPRFSKFPGPFEKHWLGNLGNLGSNKEI